MHGKSIEFDDGTVEVGGTAYIPYGVVITRHRNKRKEAMLYISTRISSDYLLRGPGERDRDSRGVILCGLARYISEPASYNVRRSQSVEVGYTTADVTLENEYISLYCLRLAEVGKDGEVVSLFLGEVDGRSVAFGCNGEVVERVMCRSC